MSKVIFSDNSKSVEIEDIAEFTVAVVKPAKIDAFNLPYNIIEVQNQDYMQYLDKEQLQYLITRLQQMEKLL